MGWLLYLPFSYLFGTWLAGLQSKGDGVEIKDSYLGPQCLPLACLGALGGATHPLPPPLSSILWGGQVFRSRVRMGFSVPPGPQNYPQGRRSLVHQCCSGSHEGLATMGSESRDGGEGARELDTTGLDALGLRVVRPLLSLPALRILPQPLARCSFLR